MKLSCTPREAFPLLRQLLYDSFQVDSWFFSWPYEQLERIDHSIRKTLWGDSFHAPTEFRDLQKNFPGHNIILLKSTLRFFNIICILSSDPHPDFISVGPFREQETNASFLTSTARENRLSGEAVSILQTFYSSMPLADPDSVVSFLSHFLSALFPDYDRLPPVHVSFSETAQKLIFDQEFLLSQNAGHAEQYAREYQETIHALCSGDVDAAHRSLRSWLALSGFPEESHTGRLRRHLSILNELFAAALLSCPIHPVYIRELAHKIQTRIDSTENHEALCALPGKILRQYCFLAKKESHSGCSPLTRHVIDYIHIHLSEELSLSVLAEKFNRHPAALSGSFRKETGMTVTAWIRRERIRKAVYYLNASSLGIREIASAVGFHDLGYFSRVFRTQTGMSPSDYRKHILVPPAERPPVSGQIFLSEFPPTIK